MLGSLVLVPATAGLKPVELGFFSALLYCDGIDGWLGSKLHGGSIGGAPHSDLLSGGVCFSPNVVATKFLLAGYCVLSVWVGDWGMSLSDCSTSINE